MFNRKEYLKKYPPADWAVNQTIRFDRGWMVEDVCEHGCGHPNKAWVEAHPGVFTGHGCCGCCQGKALAVIT